MNLPPIYALVIASLIVPAVAIAAPPQMPEDFQGTFCYLEKERGLPSPIPTDVAIRAIFEGMATCADTNPEKIEITATKVNIPAISVSCVVHQVTKFDVCPWGMIYKNRKKAQALRSSQINPWGPGYQIVFQCTSTPTRPETIGTDWLIEKGSISVGDVPRDYRCPWDRRGAR
jgi:hypothetical protein